MENTAILLMGFAGTGKYSVARELAQRTGAKIVDNHYVNNPIFGLLQLDGKTKLPEEVWVQVRRVRNAVHDTIARLSPKTWSFIFTLDVVDDPEDVPFYDAVKITAQRRNARFIPVRLVCEPEELARRIVSPRRKERMKATDPETARTRGQRERVYDPPEGALTIDTTSLRPSEVADVILRTVG